MIRDPSDGTVKEKPSKEITSALAPTTSKSDYLERLERSREWLRSYRVNASHSSITGET